MVMSFHAVLVESRAAAHLYRVLCDAHGEGEKVCYVVLDAENHQIAPAESTGVAVGSLRMLLQEGNLTPPTLDGSVDEGSISRADFAQISTHIGRHWMRTGEPPAEVTRYFG